MIRLKAVDLAKTKAETMAAAAKTNFAAAAKAAGVEVKSTELITRGTAFAEVGISSVVDDAVFALKVNETTGPIATNNAVVVARVKERQDLKPEDMAKSRPALRDRARQRARKRVLQRVHDQGQGQDGGDVQRERHQADPWRTIIDPGTSSPDP